MARLKSRVEAQKLHALDPGETEFGQPFPGEPIASGRFGRPSPLSLMYAGKGLLLGYSAGGPHWGLWSYDRTATGGDSSALRLSRSGLWSRNVSSSALDSSVQRELTCLGGDLVLEYEPGSCGYTVWPLLRKTAELGGNVRTGMEDTFYRLDGSRATESAMLIEDLVTVCREEGRTPATVEETRRIVLGE